MDCSEIPSKPWIPLSMPKRKLYQKRRSIFASYTQMNSTKEFLKCTRDKSLATKSKSAKTAFTDDNQKKVSNHGHFVSQNMLLLDANHPILKDSLPAPNPSFAYHQFHKTIKSKKTKMLSKTHEILKRILTADMLFDNCCCDCQCFSCMSQKYGQKYRTKVRDDYLSCDSIDISSLGLFEINSSQFCLSAQANYLPSQRDPEILNPELYLSSDSGKNIYPKP